MITGAELLAQYFLNIGVEKVYGIIGVPITVLAENLVNCGVAFIGFRNEQAASYASSVDAYLNCEKFIGEKVIPGVLVCVSGPGFIHSLPGIQNAISNKWPLLVITATPDDSIHGNERYLMRFQELDHSSFLNNDYCECFRLNSQMDPLKIQGILDSLSVWRRNPSKLISVLEVSGSFLEAAFKVEKLTPNIPSSVSKKTNLSKKCLKKFGTESFNQLVNQACFPLICFGTEALYNRWERIIGSFISQTGIPYLAMPMAKGTIDLPNDAGKARSLALRTTKLLILFGITSDWMLPVHEMMKKRNCLQVIRVDTKLNEKDPLLEDYSSIRERVHFFEIGKFAEVVDKRELVVENFDHLSFWNKEIEENAKMNEVNLNMKIFNMKAAEEEEDGKLCYYSVYGILQEYIKKETFLIAEGSQTMDIARIMLSNSYPRGRLDAGKMATMGIGIPYLIAASLSHPRCSVMLIVGDSAFGFSMAEIETAARYGIKNTTIVIMNNSGIYNGIPEDQFHSAKRNIAGIPLIPPTALSPHCQYQKLAAILPDRLEGFLVITGEELRNAMGSRDPMKISIINVIIK